MDDVAEKIIEIKLQNPTTKILVFCQFPVMKDQLLKTLPKNSCLDGFSFTPMKVEKFKEALNQSVLIMRTDGPNATGLCLGIAHHIMFISPYVASGAHNQTSNTSQTIDCAYRYKQTWGVNIWHFLWKRSTGIDSVMEAKLVSWNQAKGTGKDLEALCLDPGRGTKIEEGEGDRDGKDEATTQV